LIHENFHGETETETETDTHRQTDRNRETIWQIGRDTDRQADIYHLPNSIDVRRQLIHREPFVESFTGRLAVHVPCAAKHPARWKPSCDLT